MNASKPLVNRRFPAILQIAAAIWLFAILPLGANTPVLDDKIIRERLAGMDSLAVDMIDHPVVRGYLRRYLVNDRKLSAAIMGRTLQYFPLFEKYLRAYGLPDELKYLPIVESALQLSATSRVGAVGLWQFMPETGRAFGLEINDYVDERMDPVKSTRAAMEYLKSLHDRFQNWELALSAYNAGAGRVRRAIRRSGSRKFWTLRKYLPRETRNYVPAFIAATYLANYHNEHDILIQVPPLDLQLSEPTLVTETVTFDEIARVTGLSIELIRTLNPAFIHSFVPGRAAGYIVHLPKRATLAFRDFLRTAPENRAGFLSDDQRTAAPQQEQYSRKSFVVREKISVAELAGVLRQDLWHLRAWNNLQTDTLEAHSSIAVFVPVQISRWGPVARKILADLPFLEPENLPEKKINSQHEVNPDCCRMQVPHVYIRKAIRLDRLAGQLSGLSAATLAQRNNLKTNQKVKTGTLLRLDL